MVVVQYDTDISRNLQFLKQQPDRFSSYDFWSEEKGAWDEN